MERKKIYYGWFVVFGCLMITCTMVPPIMALSNKFLIQVTGELQISRSAFTLANTILQGLGIFLSPVVSARLARGNMKRIQTVSIIGFVLSYASFSLATNVIHLYISSFFTGIFFLNASLIPVSMMITNWFVKKRGLAMSIAMAGIGVGGTIFSPVITWLLGAYGWRSTYRIMALIILVLALPAALFILRKRPEDMGLLPYGSQDSTIENSSLQDSSSRDAASKRIPQKADVMFPLSVKESRTKLFFILFIFGMLCNGLINTGSLGHFPPAIEELQGPQVQALIISLYSMIGIFGSWSLDGSMTGSALWPVLPLDASPLPFPLSSSCLARISACSTSWPSSSAWEMLSAPSPLRLSPPPSLALKNTARHTESPTALHKSAFPWERSWWLPYTTPAAPTTQPGFSFLS